MTSPNVLVVGTRANQIAANELAYVMRNTGTNAQAFYDAAPDVDPVPDMTYILAPRGEMSPFQLELSQRVGNLVCILNSVPDDEHPHRIIQQPIIESSKE